MTDSTLVNVGLGSIIGISLGFIIPKYMIYRKEINAAYKEGVDSVSNELKIVNFVIF